MAKLKMVSVKDRKAYQVVSMEQNNSASVKILKSFFAYVSVCPIVFERCGEVKLLAKEDTVVHCHWSEQ